MTYSTIIVLCVIVIIAYIFEITAKKTKIPGVVLLMTLGVLMRLIAEAFHISIPNLNFLLPILGTLGLILIVLEGGLELELKSENISIIKKSIVSALLSILIPVPILMFGVVYYFEVDWRTAILNIIPLCVMSSAIAIPSVNGFDEAKKEFVIYESSIADILGIVAFNFFELNETYGLDTFSVFVMNFVYITIISVVASLGMSYMLQIIQMHVKFVLILSILILVYSIAKILHLPSLLLVLVFGLFLNNVHLIKFDKFQKIMKPDQLAPEIDYFEKIVLELTFIVKTFFFIIFGYLIDLEMLANLYTLTIAAIIMGIILLTRIFILLIHARDFINPLLFIAPRGLISILLYLSIPMSNKIDSFNSGLVTQVILLSVIVMLIGVMSYKQKKTIKNEEKAENHASEHPS